MFENTVSNCNVIIISFINTADYGTQQDASL